MFPGRTKRDIPIKKTIGMRTPSHKDFWFLVADRSKVRLLTRKKRNLGDSFELVEIFLNPDGRKKGRELISDRPGRSFDSHDRTRHGQTGGTRHSYGNSSLPEDHVTENLVKRAVGLVEEYSLKKGKAQLLVFAEPGLMGLLRPAFQHSLPALEKTFYEKDFAWLNGKELEERLQEMLTNYPSEN